MLTKQTLAISGLAVALLSTNSLWAMHAFKQAVAVGDLQQQVDDASALLDQALAVLPVVADEEASQEEVIAAAQPVGAAIAPVERDGFIWVEHLGMRFDDEGRLISVTTGDAPSDMEAPSAEDMRLEGGIVASQGHPASESI